MRSVIYNLGGSHGRSALQIVDTQSLAAFSDILRAHIVLSESSHCTFTDLIIGNCRYKLCIMSVISQRYSYISLTAAVTYIKLIRLNKFLVVRGGQSQHNLTHCNNFCHFNNSFLL